MTCQGLGFLHQKVIKPNKSNQMWFRTGDQPQPQQITVIITPGPTPINHHGCLAAKMLPRPEKKTSNRLKNTPWSLRRFFVLLVVKGNSWVSSCFLIGNSNKIPLQVEVVFFFPKKKWIENDQNGECTSCSFRDYTPIWGSRDIRINSNPSSRRNNRNHYRRLPRACTSRPPFW